MKFRNILGLMSLVAFTFGNLSSAKEWKTCAELIQKSSQGKRDAKILEAATFLSASSNRSDVAKWEASAAILEAFYQKLAEKDPRMVLTKNELLDLLNFLNTEGRRLIFCEKKTYTWNSNRGVNSIGDLYGVDGYDRSYKKLESFLVKTKISKHLALFEELKNKREEAFRLRTELQNRVQLGQEAAQRELERLAEMRKAQPSFGSETRSGQSTQAGLPGKTDSGL